MEFCLQRFHSRFGWCHPLVSTLQNPSAEAGGARSTACPPKATGPQALGKVSRVTKASGPQSLPPPRHPPSCPGDKPPPSEMCGSQLWKNWTAPDGSPLLNPQGTLSGTQNTGAAQKSSQVSSGRQETASHREFTCPQLCQRHLAAASNTAPKRRELCGTPPTCSGPGSL